MSSHSPQEIWLISAPGEKSPQDTWDRLQSATSSISTNYKFNVPDLKVGTLDQLVGLSDDLAKLDSAAEQYALRRHYNTVFVSGQLGNWFSTFLRFLRRSVISWPTIWWLETVSLFGVMLLNVCNFRRHAYLHYSIPMGRSKVSVEAVLEGFERNHWKGWFLLNSIHPFLNVFSK